MTQDDEMIYNFLTNLSTSQTLKGQLGDMLSGAADRFKELADHKCRTTFITKRT